MTYLPSWDQGQTTVTSPGDALGFSNTPIRPNVHPMTDASMQHVVRRGLGRLETVHEGH